MRKKVLILEDMETTRTALKRIVESCDDAITAYAFSEVGPALACMMENHIDLFFVDIILKPQVANDFSGIKFAEYVRQQEEYFGVDIIFVTSLIGLEAELLRKIHCYDYIEKPIQESRVRKVVMQAFRKMHSTVLEDAVCFVRKDKVSYAVHEKDIVMLSSRHKKLYIIKTDDELEIPNLSLNHFLKQIRTQKFLIPTKGIAVNYAYLEYVDPVNRYVKLRGRDELIEIGTRMKKQFLDEIEELYSEYIDENSWIQKKGYNEKRILSEVLRLVKTEKYYNKLYPDSNELACNQKIKAYRDRAFIYNNINEVERKYKELNNVNNVSEKEVIKKSIDSVKADNYFKELYANFDNLNKSERIKAYRDKITIKNNIEKIDEIITSNKEITLANAIKNIQVQETFEGLYPNFNELSIKDKIEALNKKKQLYKNTGNNISSKKYSNKFNKQSNKNTVSTRQKIEEKNNNLKNTLQSNDEYIEVNLSWKEKLINKINVIKRILKKQKALPENK